MTVSGDQQTRGSGFRRSADQGTNIRLRLRFSFRLLSFGYVLNDDLRLTQPIRAAHPLHEILLYICRERSTNQLLFMQNKPNFQDTQMNVSIFSKMAYENIANWTLGENKPNSNPIKPNFQKAKMNVNSLITKDYRKNDDFAVRKNKPNSKPISSKAKMNANLLAAKDYENESP